LISKLQFIVGSEKILFFFLFFFLKIYFFWDFIPFGEVLGKNYIILVVAPKLSLDSFEWVLKSGFDRIIEFKKK
jgi:hypothetical protein